MGMFTISTPFIDSMDESPRASLPNIATTSPLGSKSLKGFSPSAPRDIACKSNFKISASPTDSNTGICHSEPAVLRTTFGENMSTLPGEVITPSIPKASADLKIVPALPGS